MLTFRCRLHDRKVPCPDCMLNEYRRCIKENEKGKKPPHDLTEVKKALEKHGISV